MNFARAGNEVAAPLHRILQSAAPLAGANAAEPV